MDPATIAAAAVALLNPFLRQVRDEFAGAAGQAVWGVAERLLGRLRAALGGDDRDAETLDAFERDPQAAADEFAALMRRRLEEDHDLRTAVAALLADARQAGPSVRVVQRMVEAEAVVGLEARRMKSGRAEVEQEAQHARGVTGVKLDELG